MVITLVIDYGELVKVALKKRGVGKRVGRWVKSVGAAWFVAHMCVWVHFCCCGGPLCQGLQALGLCAVGRVG
jgi:hypothetical protein